MVVVREVDVVVNAIDNVSAAINRIDRSLDKMRSRKIDLNIQDNTSATVRKVADNIDDLQRAASQPLSLTAKDLISRHIDSIGKQLDILRAKAIIPVGLSTGAAAAGLAAGALGVAAVGGVAAAGVGLAAQSEEMMIRVNKLIGLTGEEARNVSSDVDKLRIKTGSSESEVAAVYEMAGSSAIGLDKINKGKELEDAGDAAGAAEQYRLAREEISGWAEQVLMAKVAFGTSSEEVAGSMSAIATSFKPAETSLLDFTKSLTSAIDYFADETPGKVTESGLLMAMQTASAGLQKIQPTDEQVSGYAALAASIMSVGKSGDHTGEVMRKVFITMQGDAENIAKAMGMSMKEYQNLLDTDAQKILDLALEKYTTLKGQDAVEFAKLFGDAYGTEMFAAVAGSRDKFDAYMASKGKGAKAYEDASRIGTSFEGAKAGTLSQLSSIKESILVIGKAIGMIFLPAVNLLLTVINKLLGPMALLADRFVQVADSIPGLNLAATVVSVLAMATGVRLLAPLLLQTATNLGIMTTATKVFTMYTNITTGAIKAMGTTLVKALAFSLANPIALVIALAAAVGYLLYKTGYLQKAWDKFRESAIGKDLIGGLVAAVDWVTSAFGALFSWLDKQWSEMGTGAAGSLLGILDSIMQGFGWVFEKIDAAYSSIKSSSGAKMGIAVAIMPILAPIMLAVRALDQILDVGKIIQDAAGVGISLWKKMVEGITWLYDKAKDGVRFISDIFDKLTEVFNAIIALPGDIAAKIKSWLPGGGGEEGGRTPEENEAGYEIEENYGAGVHAMGPNEDVIPPNEFAMNYLNYGTKFGEEPVYGQNNEPLLNSEGEQLKVKDIYPIEKVEQDLTKIIKNNEVLKSTDGISFGEGTRAQDWLQKAVKAKEPNDVALHMWSHLGPGIVNEGNESVTEKIGAFFGVTPTPTARAFRAEEGQLGGYDIYNGENVLRKNMGIPTLEEAQKRVDEFNALSQQQIEARKDQFAGGAVFNKGGLFTGIVHEKEEIIPQATAQRGAGPISKALADLQSTGHAREKAVNIHVDGMKVELNNPVVPDAGAAYHLTDILKRELEPFIEEKVKRSIGQYIT